MTIVIYKDENFSNTCILCGRNFKHSFRYSLGDFEKPLTSFQCEELHKQFLENRIKTVKLITHCGMCRDLINKIKETKKKLNSLETDFEYLSYIKHI